MVVLMPIRNPVDQRASIITQCIVIPGFVVGRVVGCYFQRTERGTIQFRCVPFKPDCFQILTVVKDSFAHIAHYRWECKAGQSHTTPECTGTNFSHTAFQRHVLEGCAILEGIGSNNLYRRRNFDFLQRCTIRKHILRNTSNALFQNHLCQSRTASKHLGTVSQCFPRIGADCYLFQSGTVPEQLMANINIFR